MFPIRRECRHSALRLCGGFYRRLRRADFQPLRLEWLESRTLLSTYYPSVIGDGAGNTLRAAIIAANANPGADTIVLGGNTYRLVIPNDRNINYGIEDDCFRGDLDVADTLTIQGAGRDVTIIDAQGIDRVFENFSYLCLRDLTVTGGLATNAYEQGGGGILSTGELVLEDCRVIANTSDADYNYERAGGGIHTSGPLTLTNTIISENTCHMAAGGGVYSSYTSTLHTNSIVGCTFTNNQSVGGGGLHTSGGIWSVSNSLFSGNHGDYFTIGPSGGAIANGGAITVTNSTFSANQATTGGGFYNTGTATVSGCTFTGNSAGGSMNIPGGGGAANTGTLTILNSTFFGNTTNVYGGGVCAMGGTLTLADCTISGNSAWAGGGVSSTGQYGTNGTINLKNTIVAGNTLTGSGGVDLHASFVSQGNNLIGDGADSTGFTNGVNGDLVGTTASPIDPMLGTLQDNGGPTQTMALLVGSPAIDAGNNSGAPATDQRGFARIVDGNGNSTATIDIGAYEYAPDITPPTAMANPSSVVVDETSATFAVTYTDPDDAVLVLTIDGNDILVTGPAGFSQFATLVSVTPSMTDGSPRTATYRVSAPGGMWEDANAGTYTATMQADQVSDMHGNFVVAGVLGTFSIAPRPVRRFHGDFNGDGTSDVLWQNQLTGLVGAWIIKNGTFTSWVGMGQVDPSVWQVIGTSDFNGDGTSDILWQNETTGLVGAWIIKNGVFTSWAGMGQADPSVWRVVGTGDFNADKTTDILWQNQSSGLVGAWLMKTGAMNGWAGFGQADPIAWQVVGTGDFNGDGTSDILWQNRTTGLVGAWKIKGAAFSGWAGFGQADPAAWQVVGIGDFNGDKTSDVLWQSQSSGLVGAWLIKNAAFSAWVGTGQADPSEWKIVGAGDYNGNRTSDILWHNQSGGLVGTWLIQNGAFAAWAGIGQADPTVWQVLGGGVSSGSALHAANVIDTAASNGASLTQSDLQPIIQEAIARWASTGLNAASIAKLTQVEFAIGDLSGSLLGKAEGSRITLDLNAAGNGWFVDSTPALDEEYSVASSKRLKAIDPRAVDRIDLLTVVEHELGHILGFDDLDGMANDLANDVMSGVLESGVRAVPYKDRADAVLAVC